MLAIKNIERKSFITFARGPPQGQAKKQTHAITSFNYWKGLDNIQNRERIEGSTDLLNWTGFLMTWYFGLALRGTTGKIVEKNETHYLPFKTTLPYAVFVADSESVSFAK
jgi:hypothetical protein